MNATSLRERLLDLVALVLPVRERAAVLGDLREEGVGLLSSSLEILSLAVRIELAPWVHADYWLVLIAVTTPIAISLGSVSLSIADGNAIYTWLFASNLDTALLSQRGFWVGLQGCLPALAWSMAALVCWAWSCGSIIGSVARKTARTSGLLLVLFFIALWFGLRPPTTDLRPLVLARDLPNNSAAFQSHFYRQIFSPLVQLLFVLIPLLCGLQSAQQRAFQRKWPRRMFWLFVGLSLVSLLAQSTTWWQRRTWTTSPALVPHLFSLTPLAVCGGVAWLIAKQAHQGEPIQISKETF